MQTKIVFCFALCSLIRTFAPQEIQLKTMTQAMKKILFLIIAAMMATMSAMAQTNLTGRVYHSPNIMATMFAGKIDIDKEIAEARKKAIAENEKKKGRKLTQEEIAKLDKEIAQKTGEIKQKAKELENAIVMSMTVEFTTATDAVVKMKGKVDEETLKKFDVGWLKRKAIRMYVSSAPELQKVKYEIQGNKVILIDGKERDTLTLSADGKTLSGVHDKDTKYTLKQTK